MPRITITISDQQHQLFQALSKYTGKSMSSSIVEYLQAATPALERMAALFQRIHEQQQKEKQRITSELKQAQDTLEPLASSMLDQLDMFIAKVSPDLMQQAGDLNDRTAARFIEPLPAAGRPSAQPISPRTNRGDTPPLEITPKPASNKAHSLVKSSELLKKNKGLNS